MTHELSDFRAMRYSFDFDWQRSLLDIYIFIQKFKETERVAIYYLQPAAAILKFVIPFSLSSPITYFVAFNTVIFWRTIESVIATQ